MCLITTLCARACVHACVCAPHTRVFLWVSDEEPRVSSHRQVIRVCSLRAHTAGRPTGGRALDSCLFSEQLLLETVQCLHVFRDKGSHAEYLFQLWKDFKAIFLPLWFLSLVEILIPLEFLGKKILSSNDK